MAVKVWGVSCSLDDEFVVVILELAESEDGTLAFTEVLRHRTNPDEDLAKKLLGIRADLDATVKNTAATVAVVRALDRAPFGRRQSTTEGHLHMEGVVLSSLRRQIDVVVPKNGKQIGDLCGSSKDAVAAEAAERFGPERQEAGMAALAALRLAKKG